MTGEHSLGTGGACGHIKVHRLSLFPHQREFCTEGLLGRHALGMLGRTLCTCTCTMHTIHQLRSRRLMILTIHMHEQRYNNIIVSLYKRHHQWALAWNRCADRVCVCVCESVWQWGGGVLIIHTVLIGRRGNIESKKVMNTQFVYMYHYYPSALHPLCQPWQNLLATTCGLARYVVVADLFISFS